MQSLWFNVADHPIHVRASNEAAQAIKNTIDPISDLDGRPFVVLVHGLVVSGAYMEKLAESLSVDFPVLVPDFPGFGKSSGSWFSLRSLSIDQMADFLCEWLELIRLEKVVLLGNSFGCQIIANFAARYPQKTLKIILQGPTDPAAKSFFAQGLRWIQNSPKEPVGLLPIIIRDYLRAGPIHFLVIVRKLLQDDIRENLRKIHVPTLVVIGDLDPIAPFKWGTEAKNLLPKGELLVLPNLAHTINYSGSESLAAVTRHYILYDQVVLPRTSEEVPFVAAFDSAVGMFRALSRKLLGRDFPQLGLPSAVPNLRYYAGATVNLLPPLLRDQVYSIAGVIDAISPEDLKQVKSEQICQSVVKNYIEKKYPVIFIGSSNGALTHLYSAMEVPWLPQTFLLPLRRPSQADGPDDMQSEMYWGKPFAKDLLDNNPDLQLHHMLDPNQDALMSKFIAYFRVKKLTLGEAYTKFITENLEKNGTIVIVNCKTSWPATKVADRHYFQAGAVGGLSIDEILHGGPRVEEFLKGRFNRRHKRWNWNAPRPDCHVPEAEWGFAESLREDILQLASNKEFRVKEISFEDPEDLSPLVADLHVDWYTKLNRPTTRMLVSSFITMEPHWTLRTASIPFWTVFPLQSSFEVTKKYVENSKYGQKMSEMFVMLFSNGANSVGTVSIEDWKQLMQCVGPNSSFVGVDEKKFPQDFASFVRYSEDIKKITQERYFLPNALTMNDVFDYLETHKNEYKYKWTEAS